jgi:hypothetical protein
MRLKNTRGNIMHHEKLDQYQKAVADAVRHVNKNAGQQAFNDQSFAVIRHACVSVNPAFTSGDDYLNMICIELMIDDKLDQADLWHKAMFTRDLKPCTGLLVESVMFDVPGIDDQNDDENDPGFNLD